jgi:hypothetical protein
MTVSCVPLTFPLIKARVMADKPVMFQSSICAANGEIVITCHGATALVSPRRARPWQHVRKGLIHPFAKTADYSNGKRILPAAFTLLAKACTATSVDWFILQDEVERRHRAPGNRLSEIILPRVAERQDYLRALFSWGGVSPSRRIRWNFDVHSP